MALISSPHACALFICVIVFMTSQCNAILFPYGTGQGDASLYRNDDGFTNPPVSISGGPNSFTYFGNDYTSVYVSIFLTIFWAIFRAIFRAIFSSDFLSDFFVIIIIYDNQRVLTNEWVWIREKGIVIPKPVRCRKTYNLTLLYILARIVWMPFFSSHKIVHLNRSTKNMQTNNRFIRRCPFLLFRVVHEWHHFFGSSLSMEPK